MAEGRFEAKTLTFQVSKKEFVVDCGMTGQLAADEKCGQKTFMTLTLPLDPDGRQALKEALCAALADLEALDLAKA